MPGLNDLAAIFLACKTNNGVSMKRSRKRDKKDNWKQMKLVVDDEQYLKLVLPEVTQTKKPKKPKKRVYTSPPPLWGQSWGPWD